MTHASFIHLRVRSAYSLAASCVTLGQLKELCLSNEMPAVAVTDDNNLFGALEFSEAFSAAGLQPIIGAELLISEGKEKEIEALSPSEGSGSVQASGTIVLLAQNGAGYERLMALTSQVHLAPADQDSPSLRWEDLEGDNEGLILLTGGATGPLAPLLRANEVAAARERLNWLQSLFPDRVYVEVQRHSGDDRPDGRYPDEPALVELAYELDLPLVATNQVVFPKRSDHAAHDALLCIAHGRYISEEDRPKASEEQYFKAAEDMSALFADLPEAISNTLEIARRCAFRPRTAPPILPSFADDLAGEVKALRDAAVAGLKDRLAVIELSAPEDAYWARLDKELGIIEKMGFPGYFLIVADFIQWAKGQGIPVGPGRGSGAGSLVAYALTITDLDPLKFDLLFERFLNPERVSMPDFDVDFCQDRRDEVIGYVQERYGRDRVAQIITFGKLQARAVLRDVGRVLQMPFGQVDRLCKMVPNNPANPVTLGEAIAGEPRFAEEQQRDQRVVELLDIAQRLEGLYRHASTHAAGVVIGDRPLEQIVPLYRDPRSDMPATQFNMKWVEPAGLVKFDFLGLKTLTVIQRAVDYLKQSGLDLNIDTIPLGDEATYQMLGRGDAVGVFQLESAGMRATLRGLHADCLQDLIALVSLYRPGPMDNIPTYIARKKGDEPPDYLHPLLEDILKETYGVIIYQEQVMQIAQVLSGYSLGEADLLRRAMGKKKKEEMDKQKLRFIDGAKEKDVNPAKAEGIFELVAKFAGYGFNKSHAAAYAWISYQTAYLKANHPAEFLAASMSLDAALTDKLAIFVSEARNCGVTVEPPCVNRSVGDFSVQHGRILYALAAVKNVSGEAMGEIVRERQQNGPFKDIYDLAERVALKRVGRRSVEQLAKSGAFDALQIGREQVVANADFLMRYSASVHEERASAQGGLFGGQSTTQLARPVLQKTAAWSVADRLESERTALGFYLSGHPLDEFTQVLEERKITPYTELVAGSGEDEGRRAVAMAGVVRDITRRRSKSGSPFAWVLLSDRTGEYEITVFSNVLAQCESLLEVGRCLSLTVTAEEQNGGLRLTAERLTQLEAPRRLERKAAGIEVAIDRPETLELINDRLRSLPAANALSSSEERASQSKLKLVLSVADCAVEIEAPLPVEPTRAVAGALKSIDGVARASLL